MNVIQREAYPVIFKVIADAELKLSELTGCAVKLNMRLSQNEVMTKKEANRLRLQLLVCTEFELSWAQIAGPKRDREIVNARKAYSFIACNILKQTTTETAKDLHRDHTSVIHLRDTCINHILLNDTLKNNVENIKTKLTTDESTN